MAVSVIAIVLVLLVLGFLIRSRYEITHLKVKEYDITSSKLPEGADGVKFCFLSDLHGYRFDAGNASLIAKIRDIRPDGILIGGDMMRSSKKNKAPLAPLEELLEALSPEFPVYCGDGNHEDRLLRNPEDFPGWYESFTALLQKYGVIYLRNRTVQFPDGNSKLFLSGITLDREYYDHGKKRRLPEGYFREKLGNAEEGFHVVLLHSPLYGESAAAWGADVVLSGHFHGGTVYLGERLGGLMTPQYQFFSKFCQGRKDLGNGKTEIISSGLGTHTVNLRINDFPELTVITLRKEKA